MTEHAFKSDFLRIMQAQLHLALVLPACMGERAQHLHGIDQARADANPS